MKRLRLIISKRRTIRYLSGIIACVSVRLTSSPGMGDATVFVEVKTRRSLKFGTPQTAVTLTKQKQISKVALSYLQKHNLLDAACRFDVIAVFLSLKCELIDLQHIENAFQFRAMA